MSRSLGQPTAVYPKVAPFPAADLPERQRNVRLGTGSAGEDRTYWHPRLSPLGAALDAAAFTSAKEVSEWIGASIPTAHSWLFEVGPRLGYWSADEVRASFARSRELRRALP